MLSDDEIKAIDVRTLGCIHFARAIITAHTTKLLEGVEMPESVAISAMSGKLYSADQLQAYAAAVAVKARVKALDEAKLACEEVDSDSNGEKYDMFGSNLAAQCAAAIEKLKEQV